MKVKCQNEAIAKTEGKKHQKKIVRKDLNSGDVIQSNLSKGGGERERKERKKTGDWRGGGREGGL